MKKHRLLLAIFVFTASFIAQANDFSRQLHPRALTEILVGEQSHYVYEINAKIPLPLGVSWIFVSEGKGKLSFSAAHRLADSLSEKGWHVVIVSPTWLSTAPAMAASTSDVPVQPRQSVQQQDIEFDGASVQLLALLTQLTTHSEDKVGFRLFIAEGMAASLLLALGDNPQAPAPDALTVVSPFWPDDQINYQVSAYSANYPYPLLDIAYSSANNWSRATDIARLIEANVQIKMHYRQRQLPRHVGRQAADWLSGEIVGWTRSLGW